MWIMQIFGQNYTPRQLPRKAHYWRKLNLFSDSAYVETVKKKIGLS
uniref:Uncharacterized protein n=1 Tax=Anguilla anguilla TaxID=7936 RepID=A0A0E9T849_ANGAN